MLRGNVVETPDVLMPRGSLRILRSCHHEARILQEFRCSIQVMHKFWLAVCGVRAEVTDHSDTYPALLRALCRPVSTEAVEGDSGAENQIVLPACAGQGPR